MNTQNGLSDPRSLVQARLTARTGALVRTTSDHFSWVARDNVVGRPGGGEGVGATRFKPLLKKKVGRLPLIFVQSSFRGSHEAESGLSGV